MKENLRTTKYADGTTIAQGSSTSSSTRYYYNLGNAPSYGYLYNWPAVKGPASVSANNQGVCPDGWHVPSDAEWTQLTEYVGSQSQYVCSNNTTYIAKALAATTGWNSATATYACHVGNSQSSNNATGFSALPAGLYRDYGYAGSGETAGFWSATEESSTSAYRRYFLSDNSRVTRDSGTKEFGESVRCVRD
jgi:uncharacterized protein (TIGR02145 family)